MQVPGYSTGSAVIEHRRSLDLRSGVLHRDTVFGVPGGARARLRAERFTSTADRDLCCLRIEVTCLDHAGGRSGAPGGFGVIGVDRGSGASALWAAGADVVVSDLAELVEDRCGRAGPVASG
ncbi:hypothetical protein ACIO14_19985 [Nocardia fluminea]|uniref:hypothetical protein n=1 Tax=Nocardia fluminea TaxID=134984 RepID=UPI00382BE7A7